MIRYTNSNQLTDNPSLCVHIVSKDEKYLCTKEEKQLLKLAPPDVVTLLLDAWQVGDVLEFCYLLETHKLTQSRAWDTLPRINDGFELNANALMACRAYILEDLAGRCVFRSPLREYPTIGLCGGFLLMDGIQIATTHEDCVIYTMSSFEDTDLILMGMIAMLKVIWVYEDGVRLTNRRFIELAIGYEGE